MKQLINLSMIVFISLLELAIMGVANAADFTPHGRVFIELVQHETSELASPDSIPSKQVYYIIRNHLNSQMTKKLLVVSGVSLRVAARDDAPAFQLALLELVYSNITAALWAQQKLPENAYFKVSKILTPFSSAVIDNRLFIVFTETAGNQQALELIKHFPEKWNQKNDSDALKE